MDFRVFPELKAQLRGVRFDSADDLTKQAQAVVSSFSEEWYVETYTKWISRHRKCVDLAGDYVEQVRRSLDLNDAWRYLWHRRAPGMTYMLFYFC